MTELYDDDAYSDRPAAKAEAREADERAEIARLRALVPEPFREEFDLVVDVAACAAAGCGVTATARARIAPPPPREALFVVGLTMSWAFLRNLAPHLEGEARRTVDQLVAYTRELLGDALPPEPAG